MTLRRAENHLTSVDERLATLVGRYGGCELATEPPCDVLVSAIIGQQLSARAAATIRQRVVIMAGNGVTLCVKKLARISVERLRRAGLSGAKAAALKDVGRAAVRGEFDFPRLQSLDDNQVIQVLIERRGIGPWTAEMFLIFALGRLDVLSVGDMGLRRAVQKIYGLDQRPTGDEFRTIAADWRPYRSIASWYLWKVID